MIRTLSPAGDLAHGRTLPADWYTDPTVFAQERARIFRRGWHYVGHSAQVAQPGDFFTWQIDSVPVVVVCAEDGQRRAFANVCRHRGAQVVLDSCGRRKSLQCHYHGWTWGLDGTLRAAPRAAEQEAFARADFPLHQLRLDTFGPFLFVSLDPTAAPLAETTAELPGLLAAAGVRLEGLRLRQRMVYDMACNWKVAVENYLECYHCPIAHPSFTELIDLDHYRTELYGQFSLQRGPERAPTGEIVQEGLYAYVWPLWMLNTYPGPGNASLNIIVPIDERRTRAIYELYFADDYPDARLADQVAFVDQVQREDIVLCESVQRGMESGFYTQGQLMLSRESGIGHFQHLVATTLTSEP